MEWDSQSPGAPRSNGQTARVNGMSGSGGSAGGGWANSGHKSQKQLDAEGIDVFGTPVASPEPRRHGAGPGIPGMRGKDPAALVRILAEGSLTDQHDLYQWLQAGRQLAHDLALFTSAGAGELEAGAKEMLRGSGKTGLFGLDILLRIKRITRKLNGASDHFAEAAAAYVGTWKAFEHEFQELLEQAQTKPKKARHFQIDLG